MRWINSGDGCRPPPHPPVASFCFVVRRQVSGTMGPPFHRLIISTEHPSSCLEAGRGYATATKWLSCRFRVIRDRTIGPEYRAHETRSARRRDLRSASAHRVSASIYPVHREGDDTQRPFGPFNYCEPSSSARGRHRDAGGRFPVRLFSRRAGAASVAGGIIPCCRRGWDESCLATKS